MMITIFNQKELTVTTGMRQLANIRDILDANHIEHKVEDTGRFGNHIYSIYVKRKDYKEAVFLT